MPYICLKHKNETIFSLGEAKILDLPYQLYSTWMLLISDREVTLLSEQFKDLNLYLQWNLIICAHGNQCKLLKDLKQ